MTKPAASAKTIYLIQHTGTPDEIAGMVDSSTIARLKAEGDPNPVIRLYGIGREGAAIGNLLGVGPVVVNYIQHAMTKLYEKLQPGTKALHKHNATTNSHEGRTVLGEIVGKTMRVVDGALSVMAAIHVKPEHRDKKLDGASIECMTVGQETGWGQSVITDFEEITGVALFDSALTPPGIPGSVLLGAHQFYAPSGDTSKRDKKMALSKAEIQAEIRAGNYKPSDIYSDTELQGDSRVVSFVATHKQEADSAKASLETEKTARVKAEGDLKTEQAKTGQMTAQQTVKATFEKLTGTRKMDSKQTAYVSRRLDTFKLGKPEDVETDLNKFIDANLQQLRADLGDYGIKVDNVEPQSNGSTVSAPAPPSDNKGNSPDAHADNPLADPAKNDFIPPTAKV